MLIFRKDYVGENVGFVFRRRVSENLWMYALTWCFVLHILPVDGELRDIETGGPFLFKVRSHDDSYNQKSYEALGEVRLTSVCFMK